MYEGPTQLLSVMPREITVEYKIETIRLACDQVANLNLIRTPLLHLKPNMVH